MELFPFHFVSESLSLNALVDGDFFPHPASFFFIFLNVGIDAIATMMCSHVPATQGCFPSVLVSILHELEA